MKWTRLSRKVVKRFAILPILIGDNYRWLETVYVERHLYQGSLFAWWEDDCFVSKSDYLAYRKSRREKV